MNKHEMKDEHFQLIDQWWKEDNRRIFIISGYAGTGKTTLARQIPDKINVRNVAFLAPTGKAALLMDGGRTIHSYLYNPVRNPETHEVEFVRKDPRTFSEQLLIIDEVSMVSDELMDDLRSINIPMVGLGDSAQLPPVNGDNTLLNNADIFLTEIHRSDDGIVNLATDIRQGNRLKTKYDGVKFTVKKFMDDIGEVDKDAIIICKFNNTRRAINRAYREFHIPDHRFVITEGEKLVISKNNSSSGLMNGSIVVITEILGVLPKERMAIINVMNDSGDILRIRLDVSLLLGQPVLPYYVYKKHEDLHEAEYAYAITCHKSQGSEFERVYVVNEGRRFPDHQSWLYTAVTRAKKEVRIYNNG